MLLVITILMLLSSTVIVVIQMEFALVQLPINGMHPPEPKDILPVLENMKIASTFLQRVNVRKMFCGIEIRTDVLQYLLSDGIVVWRTWILFPRSMIVKMVLSICMITSTSTYALTVLTAHLI